MSDIEMLTQLTAEITANYVANNPTPVEEISSVIKAVYAALTKVEAPVAEPEQPQDFTPMISVRKSLADPAKIISMIDGKPYSMLKRHLGQHGLTPDSYRARYKLPADYPMTAPAYSEQRKAIAVTIGLGRKSQVAATEPEIESEAVQATEPVQAAETVPATEAVPVNDAVAVDEAVPGKPRRKLGISLAGAGTTAPAPAAKPRKLSGKAALAKVRAGIE